MVDALGVKYTDASCSVKTYSTSFLFVLYRCMDSLGGYPAALHVHVPHHVVQPYSQVAIQVRRSHLSVCCVSAQAGALVASVSFLSDEGCAVQVLFEL